MRSPTDEPKHYLVARVRDALARDGLALDLEVTVAGGKVFVTGEVPTRARLDSITRILRESLPGRDVSNEVRVASLTDTEEVETLS